MAENDNPLLANEAPEPRTLGQRIGRFFGSTIVNGVIGTAIGGAIGVGVEGVQTLTSPAPTPTVDPVTAGPATDGGGVNVAAAFPGIPEGAPMGPVTAPAIPAPTPAGAFGGGDAKPVTTIDTTPGNVGTGPDENGAYAALMAEGRGGEVAFNSPNSAPKGPPTVDLTVPTVGLNMQEGLTFGERTVAIPQTTADAKPDAPTISGGVGSATTARLYEMRPEPITEPKPNVLLITENRIPTIAAERPVPVAAPAPTADVDFTANFTNVPADAPMGDNAPASVAVAPAPMKVDQPAPDAPQQNFAARAWDDAKTGMKIGAGVGAAGGALKAMIVGPHTERLAQERVAAQRSAENPNGLAV